MAGSTAGELTGSAAGAVEIVPVADPFDLLGSIAGGLAGLTTGAVDIVPASPPFDISGTITGGLDGSATGVVVIVPVQERRWKSQGRLTGNLTAPQLVS